MRGIGADRGKGNFLKVITRSKLYGRENVNKKQKKN